MNYTLKSVLAVIFIVSVLGTLGVIIAQGNGGSVFFGNVGKAVGSDGLTGAVAGENCEGPDCPIVKEEVCQGYACSIACYEDKDCDDKIEATEDLCRNPGTTYSLCVNKVKKE